MAKPIIVERKGPFVTITLNRPRRGNVFTHTMMQQLAAHVNEIATDPKLRAVVLRGNGIDFCHGRDPKGPGGPPPSNAFDLHGKVFSKILDVYKAFRECPAPIVAAVQGKALGFGWVEEGRPDRERAINQILGLRLPVGRRGLRAYLEGRWTELARDTVFRLVGGVNISLFSY